MTARQFIKVLHIVKGEFPRWKAPVVSLIAHHHSDPFRILIATLLSQRTRDQTTAQTSQRLFAVADTPKSMFQLPINKIVNLIYPVGFYNTKARQIHELCQKLLFQYKGQVPSTLEELLKLKGVGRKTANLVLSLGFQKPAICVDTHVHRISNRLGIVKTKTPEQTERILAKKIPTRYWRSMNELLVGFGQTLCHPMKPLCAQCPISFCPSRKIS